MREADRGQEIHPEGLTEAQEALSTEGYRLHSALTMDKMLQFYARTGKITQDAYRDATQRLDALNQFLGVKS